MTLRPYQQDALDAIKADINTAGASLVVMPTGSGKSHIIAAAAQLSITKVLILQPSQELLGQNMMKLELLVLQKDIGVYSASFKRREYTKIFTFATIQSVYNKSELFQDVKLVIIDEAHNLAPRSLGTMYQTFFAALGNPKIIGFTATPYRLETVYYQSEGYLYAQTGLKLINRSRHKTQKECFWKRIIYHVSHENLLKEGYLAPLEYIQRPLMPYAEIAVNASHSDFDLKEYTKDIVGREATILSTVAQASKQFGSVLVFCATAEQARSLQATVKHSALVLGESHTKERKAVIEGFKNGSIRVVFNVGCLTTGFDMPQLSCVILLRPTRSPVLYQQMLGRLTRPAPGKTHGTVIDLTGTVASLGRIETFEIYKNARGLWDLRTEKNESWHDRVLFTREI